MLLGKIGISLFPSMMLCFFQLLTQTKLSKYFGHPKVQQAVAMAHKTLWVTSPNGDQKVVSVMDTATVKEILQQCRGDEGQDREANLIRGVTVLEPDMTVSEARLKDGDEVSLVWFDPFVEMACWTGEVMDRDLYVRIPPGTISIDAGAFRGCKALVKVVIPNSVTKIHNCAFAGCSSLKQVEIPNSVANIGAEAFTGCRSLTQVKIPNSVVSVGDSAFRGCNSLKQVEIPNSVTRIGDGVFYGCSSLTQVGIPDSVTRIGTEAFSGCSSLTDVKIPDSVIIGDRAFDGCSSLKK